MHELTDEFTVEFEHMTRGFRLQSPIEKLIGYKINEGPWIDFCGVSVVFPKLVVGDKIAIKYVRRDET